MIPPELLGWIAEHEALAASVAAGIGAIVLYGVLGRRFLGADDDFWEPLRRLALTRGDEAAEGTGLYASSTLPREDMVGTIPMNVEEVEEELEALGFDRNPMSSWKRSHDGRPEAGSWGLRGLPEEIDALPPAARAVVAASAEDQLHVILFERGPEATDAGAHHEASSINPEEGPDHYRGRGQDVERGKSVFRGVWLSAGLPLRSYTEPEGNDS